MSRPLKSLKAVAKYLRSLLSAGVMPGHCIDQVRIGVAERGSPEGLAELDALTVGLRNCTNLTEGEQLLWRWIYKQDAS